MSISHKTSSSEQQAINRSFNSLSEENGLLPIRVSKFYQEKVQQEVNILGHTEGPLHRAVYPSIERLTLRVPGEVKDFVDDRDNMQDSTHQTIIRKYRDRILFLPVVHCLSNCQYCFRQDVLSDSRALEGGNTYSIHTLINYIKEHPEISEVIISGGDPLTLTFDELKCIIESLISQTHIRNIRIHSRGLVFNPTVFTPEKTELLGANEVRLVSHIVHPYEICDEVRKHIDRLLSHKIRLYNQFPLLRKINDHSEVLIKHLLQLDNLHIRNLSIFIPDPINFSASFRISLKRIFEIADQINWNSPSWINSTRFVLDSPNGKVRREDLKSIDPVSGRAIFERNGKKIEYPDFPSKFDEPGDLETLLWKD